MKYTVTVTFVIEAEDEDLAQDQLCDELDDAGFGVDVGGTQYDVQSVEERS